MDPIGRSHQTRIYVDGLFGRRQAVPVRPDRLEAKALSRLSKNARAYLGGGAGLETTMAANRAAFERWRIVPRMLRDVGSRDLSVELFGRRLPLPLLLAPIGVLDMAHRGGDLAAAAAAAGAGIPFVASSQACHPMEAIAAASGTAPRWFQLYWSSEDAVARSFVRRAERAGYEAIVLTLDTTQLGWRPRDLDRGYLPFLRGRGIANYLTDEAFAAVAAAPGAMPAPRRPGTGILAGLLELVAAQRRGPASRWPRRELLAAIRRFVAIYSRPDLTFADIGRLRGWTDLPILVKGILDPEDAQAAVAQGASGIIVSNHGGRQVDGAIAALDALPGVVRAVGGSVPVLFDSGVRTGADVFKALSLGAAAVLIGRPYVFGLALAGEAGVAAVVDHLAAELDLTLALAGHRCLSELDARCLAREAAAP
ncbi:alpha-hydroxy-acid oxidizing protein [Jiella sonneratiae]|uniref:Alpha-hydroxy-acid oxidizing protein n=1 Tax=Jiella sonneratiae TaxID=2816856 RepID=A0ABS3IZN4_9HYPH|nr:alpha-hydroxy-acid oxidizing protein [Jiella sonneratiae]MBO0902882.1 alpha-hydroxy-acid oxidizing protein [Jiella sonneratiae]